MLPDDLINEIVHCTNGYSNWRMGVDKTITDPATKEKVKNPQYLRKDLHRKVTREDILLFFATYFYMGYCQLPAKSDYWTSAGSGVKPSHWMKNRGFSCNWFHFVWRNILLDPLFVTERYTKAADRENDDDSTVASNVDEDDSNYDCCYSSDDSDSDLDCFLSSNEEELEEAPNFLLDIDGKRKPKDYHQTYVTRCDEKWYYKAGLFLDWLNWFSKAHCKHLVRICFNFV